MKQSDSLKKTRDFQKVYQKGTSKANRYLVIYVRRNGHNINRLGISVSKKVGNSVIRHHVTRLIRESYRIHEESFQIGWDIVAVARNPAKDASFQDLEEAFLALGKKLGVML